MRKIIHTITRTPRNPIGVFRIANWVLIPLNVSEPDGTEDKLRFSLNSDKKTYKVDLNRHYSGTFGAVVIPNLHEGKAVTVIADNAFSHATGVTRVYIPHSIQEIGNQAFFACHSLVTIEVSAYNPNFASFDYCLYNKSLTELIAFPNARKTLSFPGNLTTIKKEAFSSCDVSAINNWPDSITTIEEQAFAEAQTGSSFTLPKNVITIGEEAFLNCPFSQVTFGNRIQDIGVSAFENSALASLEIPSSCRKIGSMAFARCNSLEIVKIRSGLETIESKAFAEDRNLTDINIPDTLRELASDAFEGCASTRKFVVASQNQYFASQNYVIFNKTFTRVIKCPATKTSVTLPNTVTEIGDFAFECCSNLESITIPNGVTSIGKNAFRSCTSLSSVTLGTGVLSIRENAFKLCTSLLTVSVNSPILRIEASAFESCGLNSFAFPKSLSFIGDKAFSHTLLSEIYLFDALQTIGAEAFGNCSFLTTVFLGSGLTSIGGGAFYQCTSLSTIDYEGTMAEWTSITKGSRAFYGVNTNSVICTDGNAAL